MSHAESVEAQRSFAGDSEAFPRPFGQYLLLQNFARGGMGEVYLAKIGGIAGLERTCVLKKLRAELTRDREYVTRFIDEARVVVTLSHANICHVFDVGRVGEEYYLAMEHVSGRDVRTTQDRCRLQSRVLPPATALHLVCETLEALDYAHRRNHPLTGEPLNLVHRDVSPQNVLVSFDGAVKLIDFGLAASKLKVERTQPNVVMGKMAYMAPEQARGDHIDARADLFACGVLAYEMLSGERFYEGMSGSDIWQVAGKGGFVPRRWGSIDRDLGKHIAKALHPDPQKRFATCGDFREALVSHLHWRFPGTGVRGLREVMNELFADEVREEREMLAKFGTTTVAGFRASFEESASQSVSLARADDGSALPSARLVRNEQGVPPQAAAFATHGASLPRPVSGIREVTGPPRSASGVRDLHRETTQLVGATDANKRASAHTEQQPKDPSTDEAQDAASTTTEAHTQDVAVERTMLVLHNRKSIANAASDTAERSGPVTRTIDAVWRRRNMAAIAAAVLVIAAVALLARGRDEPRAVDTAMATSPFAVIPPAAAPTLAVVPTAVLLTTDDKGAVAEELAKKERVQRKKKAGRGRAPLEAAAPQPPIEKSSQVDSKPAKLPMRDVLAIGRRCQPCADLFAAAASSTKDGPVIEVLRGCIEKRKCR